jgi:hypothetical protein
MFYNPSLSFQKLLARLYELNERINSLSHKIKF